MNGNYRKYTNEEIEKARDIDLLDYLYATEPNELVHVSNGTYSLKEHDSFKISNGKWNWFSRGFGGKGALDYLIKVKGYSFSEAMNELIEINQLPHFDRTETGNNAYKAKKEKQGFILPKPFDNNDKVTKYLIDRGIHRKIIEYFIERGALYESAKYHNAVFVGFDKEYNPKYAMQRGTISAFKGDVMGSDKRCSFSYVNANSDKLYVFESAIDALSCMTLRAYKGSDWEADNYLSLSGVYVKKEETEPPLPLALEYFLENNPNISKVVLCLDNDEIGIGASKLIESKLKDKCEVEISLPKAKDYNDEVIHMIQSVQNKKENMHKLCYNASER